ncbi:ROK family transcriptional regulator [Agromyces albus]|uniref:ROK family transcriptional regulator n=1 Tax=Agromyces albus TaxID=205332 RepID=UPI00278AEC04|nr:ROK family transcriptional regulator [Agromyces albus]MDQ0573841.1 putative NBD/HSP70 family sugar kinase [Agromyces albus]
MAWRPSDELSHAVALEVLLHGPLSRSDLARRLQLAPATLTRISTELIDVGLFVEMPELAEKRTGRPSIPLDVIPGTHHFLGVKLSGNMLMAAVTDLRADLLRYEEEPLRSHEPAEVARQIAELERRLRDDGPAAAIGIGLGGVVVDARTVASAPFLDWHTVPIAELVEAATGVPTFVANDLTAFTESQHWFGVGRGHDNFAVLTVGVGIGYGCVANGTLLANDDSGVGLVGHWPLDPFGPLCAKGHRGCAEGLLAIPSIERDVSMALGRQVTFDEALDLAEVGEPGAREILDVSGRGLGRLIAAVANLTAPDKVVIGGEGVRLAEVAAASVRDGIRADRDPRAGEVVVELVSGGNDSWCRGAAVIAIQNYVQKRRRSRRT